MTGKWDNGKDAVWNTVWKTCARLGATPMKHLTLRAGIVYRDSSPRIAQHHGVIRKRGRRYLPTPREWVPRAECASRPLPPAPAAAPTDPMRLPQLERVGIVTCHA